jgi:ferredoxin
MKKKAFTITSMLLPVITAFTLSGCSVTSEKSVDANLTNNETGETITNNPSNNTNTSNGDLEFSNVNIEATQLKISSGCIGCGRCVRTDPEHFAMSPGARIATVVTTENLQTSALNSAVMNCPARAIIRS